MKYDPILLFLLAAGSIAGTSGIWHVNYAFHWR